MNPGAVQDAVALAHSVGRVLVATASADGLPHVASATHVELQSDHVHIRLGEWFCPGTVRNIGENPRVSVVVWDETRDVGHQLLGEVEQILNVSTLDGYLPGEEGHPVPQIERELVVRVEEVLEFSHAPHTDVAEAPAPAGARQ